MNHPTLVILAAGLSRRFGAQKQLTPVGPDDELLHDYTIYDAMSCGFGRVVFVVRSDNEDDIRAAFDDRFGYSISASFVRQFRPLGTGHAVASIQGLVDGPFAVANADDIYGRAAIQLVAEGLRGVAAAAGGGTESGCVVGYRLESTLSEHGGVSRAVCRSGPAGQLESVEEVLDIRRGGGACLSGRHPDGVEVSLTGEERVSMNLWGFSAGVVGLMSKRYNDWTYNLAEGESGEFRLSSAVDTLLRERSLAVQLLDADSSGWIGLTHQGDREAVRAALAAAVQRGDYPPSLRRALRG